MKKTKPAITILLSALTVLVSQVVVAAPIVAPVKLTQVQGDVMVNNGSRFVKAASGLALKPGAKIVTAKSSNVSLVYQNGCVKQLKENTMHTVGTAEQCVANFSKERIYVAGAALGDIVLPSNIQTITRQGFSFFPTLQQIVQSRAFIPGAIGFTGFAYSQSDAWNSNHTNFRASLGGPYAN